MAEFETPPTFPGVKYDVAPTDIGKGYAEGIKTAGEGIAKGISSVMDVMTRKRTASDMLDTLHRTGVLKDEQYNAIAGKSLSAQEQLIGTFANQWILDQANQRALALERGKMGIEVAGQHAKFLDAYNLQRSGVVTGDASKIPWTGPAPAPAPAPAPVVPTQQQTNVAQQQAQGFRTGGGTPSLGTPQPAQPITQPGQQPIAATTPRLPGTKRIMDTQSGKKGWQYPSGATVWD